jgi:hypothetical protein
MNQNILYFQTRDPYEGDAVFEPILELCDICTDYKNSDEYYTICTYQNQTRIDVPFISNIVFATIEDLLL